MLHFCHCVHKAALNFSTITITSTKKILPTTMTCPNKSNELRFWCSYSLKKQKIFLLTLNLNIPPKCSIGKKWSFCELLALEPKKVFWYKIKGEAEHNYHFLWKEIFQVLFFMFLNSLGFVSSFLLSIYSTLSQQTL